MINHQFSLQILKIANGYLLILPLNHEHFLMTREDQVRMEAQIMKEEFTKDEILAGLNKKTEDKKNPAKILSEDNWRYFKNLRELISFLELSE